MMLRPRESHDQRLIEARLDITPKPAELRWLHDVFGNSVAIARFGGRAQRAALRERGPPRPHRRTTRSTSRSRITRAPIPFGYGLEEMPDLARSIERHCRDREREVDRWARRFLRHDGPTGTLALLDGHDARHQGRASATSPRHERGIQDPVRTLKLGSGTCRDFAVLMMEAARSLGLAARFVSGYLYSPLRSPGRDGDHVGGGSTHAWMRVYLPGAGWVEFDPTNGIVGNRDLIRVAIARDPAQALPLSGTWTGFPSDSLGMTVDVAVSSEAKPAAVARPRAVVPLSTPKENAPSCRSAPATRSPTTARSRRRCCWS